MEVASPRARAAAGAHRPGSGAERGGLPAGAVPPAAPPPRSPSTSLTWRPPTRRCRRRPRWRWARPATARSSRCSRRCARAASTSGLPGGKKETVIVGDKVSEGDKTLVPLFRAYGREALTGADGKPLLADLTTLEEVSTGRRLRIAIRPLIDAFSGQSDLANPDPATRRAAATKMGYTGDAATRQVLEDALGKERDRWARFALEEAIALIQPAHRRRRGAGGRRRGARAPAQRQRHGAALPARGRSAGARPAGRGRPRRDQAHRALGPLHPGHRDRLPGPLALLDPAADGAGARHRVRPDGRDQHGPRRADGARRLRHVPDAGLVHRVLPGLLRLLLPGRAAVRVPGVGRAPGSCWSGA